LTARTRSPQIFSRKNSRLARHFRFSGVFMTMIEMKVEGIGIDPQNNPLVLLRDDSRSIFVPIWIGLSEAVSIQMELDQRQAQRPMTHDLIAEILRELNVQLVKVTVNE